MGSVTKWKVYESRGEMLADVEKIKEGLMAKGKPKPKPQKPKPKPGGY